MQGIQLKLNACPKPGNSIQLKVRGEGPTISRRCRPRIPFGGEHYLSRGPAAGLHVVVLKGEAELKVGGKVVVETVGVDEFLRPNGANRLRSQARHGGGQTDSLVPINGEAISLHGGRDSLFCHSRDAGFEQAVAARERANSANGVKSSEVVSHSPSPAPARVRLGYR